MRSRWMCKSLEHLTQIKRLKLNEIEEHQRLLMQTLLGPQFCVGLASSAKPGPDLPMEQHVFSSQELSCHCPCPSPSPNITSKPLISLNMQGACQELPVAYESWSLSTEHLLKEVKTMGHSSPKRSSTQGCADPAEEPQERSCER